MKYFLKLTLKLTLAVVILSSAAVLVNKSVDLSSISIENLSAEKPFFGAEEYEYKAPEANDAKTQLSSRINWAILVFVVLMVFVLANAFDISKYTARITGRETVDHNKINKWMMLIVMLVGLSAAAWEYSAHGKFIHLNDSSSEHGITYDSMFTITMWLTSIVFFVCQFFLFWFSYRYAHRDGQKARYYAHNNKLEVVWTIIPAIVLTILVLRGHRTWESIVYADQKYKGTIKDIEVFAYQFGWKARYAGEDGELGEADYKFISGKNDLGLAYKPEVMILLDELNEQIKKEKENIADLEAGKTMADLKAQYDAANSLKDYESMKSIQSEIDAVNNGEKLDDLEESLYRKEKQVERIHHILNDQKLFASTFNGKAEDDIIVQEIHLAKDSMVTFRFRSKDIIHSAWLPNFRTQMNVVPGMPTKFTFKPTKTTEQAKAEFGKDFEYYLYCNKICGVSHFNMKILVVVESQEKVERTGCKTQKPAFKELPAAPAIIKSDSASMTGHY